MAVFNPMEVARQITANKEQRSRPSLVPSMPDFPTVPDRPTYTAPAREQFDWNVPIAERPQGTKDWIWSRSRWAKEDFDREQDRRVQEAQQKYALALDAWRDNVDALNKRFEQEAALVKDYYGQQGLVAPLAGDPTPNIRAAQAQWQIAKDAGDRAGMDYWHGVAEQIRADAGWGSGGADGRLTSGLMTAAGAPTWEREYQQRAYEDALAQQMWEREYQQRAYEDALAQQMWERDLALKQLAMSAARGGRSGGSAVKAEPPGGVTKATAVNKTNEAYADYVEQIEGGRMSVDQAVKNIYSQQQDLWYIGVDANELVRRLADRFGYSEY